MKKAATILFILLAAMFAGAWYLFHPAISLADPKFIGALTTAILIVGGCAYMFTHDGYEGSDVPLVISIGAVIVLFVVGFFGILIGWDAFHASEYHDQAKVESKTFSEDVETVDFSSIPLMDKDTAELIGDRAMGAMADLVSQYDISDNYSQINLEGRPVRVSPLIYDDFFKWMNSKDNGIPGYVRVDMSSENVEIVRTETPIWVTDGEYFERNIYRHVQFTYPFDVFSGFYFEIDDNGTPWWICPVRSFNVFPWGAETVNDVVLCNALTGECDKMALEDVPEWCDKVIPVDLLIDRYDWYGELGEGWWNSIFGQTNVTRTTDGYNYIVIGNDIWAYSGVTSASADNAIVGFVLMNQRTGETNFYSCAGATEESAMESAKGQVQQMEYEASFPLLVNIADQPTYIMTLKDNAGLVKMYAMVDVQRYQNVAVGNTLNQTLTNYTDMLNDTGIEADAEDVEGAVVSVSAQQVSGTIEKMTTVVKGGNTHYIVQLDGNATKYDFDVTAAIDIIDYAVGDHIDFIVVDGEEQTLVNVSEIGLLPAPEPEEGVCAECGAELPDGAEFCPACGAAVGDAAKEEG